MLQCCEITAQLGKFQLNRSFSLFCCCCSAFMIIFTFIHQFENVSVCFVHLGGKPITPNDVTDSLTNGHTTENGAVSESVTKTEVSI